MLRAILGRLSIRMAGRGQSAWRPNHKQGPGWFAVEIDPDTAFADVATVRRLALAHRRLGTRIAILRGQHVAAIPETIAAIRVLWHYARVACVVTSTPQPAPDVLRFIRNGVGGYLLCLDVARTTEPLAAVQTLAAVHQRYPEFPLFLVLAPPPDEIEATVRLVEDATRLAVPILVDCWRLGSEPSDARANLNAKLVRLGFQQQESKLIPPISASLLVARGCSCANLSGGWFINSMFDVRLCTGRASLGHLSGTSARGLWFAPETARQRTECCVAFPGERQALEVWAYTPPDLGALHSVASDPPFISVVIPSYGRSAVVVGRALFLLV